MAKEITFDTTARDRIKKGVDKLADVNHYRYNELQAADKTLYQIIKYYLDKAQRKGERVLEMKRRSSVSKAM